jgi:hypothetical protein
MCAAEKVVSDMKPSLSKDHLLVSIAAGIPIAKLQVDDDDDDEDATYLQHVQDQFVC